MPKPDLFPKDSILESQIIETMIAGLHRWRSDLHYPESHSDMQACVRSLMTMFEITRRPIVKDIPVPCGTCNGLGKIVTEFHADYSPSALKACPKCQGSKKEAYSGH